ncbi:Retrotransposon gag domain [Sesbania bispinosa]|nr:Retrotransposon gag domain [Sesbania bispinosa]
MVITRSTMEGRMENVERSLQAQQSELSEIKQILLQRDRHRFSRRSHRPQSRTRITDEEGEGSHYSVSRSRPPRRESSPPRVYDFGGRKMEIPVFTGDDTYGWLVRVECYFKLNSVLEDEKLDAVLVALEGQALNWYQWWEEQAVVRSWEDFKTAALRRFQPGLAQNPFEPLLSIKQTGTVMEYRGQFEMVSAPLRGADRIMLKGIFLNGLKEEIRAELKLGGFRWEEKKGWRDKEGSFVKIPGDSSRGKSMIPMGEKGGKSNSEPPGEKKLVEGRRLTQAELQERSRKGLCFKCGEKWGREHICKLRHYQLVLVEGQEDGEPAETEEDGDPAETEEPILELENKTLQLSLKSKEGLTSRKSFKIKGTIGGREVLILIDSGATGNFISQPLVAELQLQVTKTPEYTVEMGNGQKEKNKGICKAVQIEMQGV